MVRAVMSALWVLAAALMVNVQALGADWQNAGGGRFEFETTFEGEILRGSFREFDVYFRFVPGTAESDDLKVSVKLAAADMGDPDMNAVLFDRAWFDTERFGTAVFECKAVEALSEERFIARGLLELKGVGRPVTVPFAWWRDGNRAQMRGAFELLRTDFGVGSGEWSSADSVGLTVRLEFDIPLELIE